MRSWSNAIAHRRNDWVNCWGGDSLFRLVAPVRLNVVCFTLDNGDAAGLQRLHKALHEDGTAYLSPSMLDGRPMLRAALCNWRTTDADVEQTYAALKRLATAAVHPSP